MVLGSFTTECNEQFSANAFLLAKERKFGNRIKRRKKMCFLQQTGPGYRYSFYILFVIIVVVVLLFKIGKGEEKHASLQ